MAGPLAYHLIKSFSCLGLNRVTGGYGCMAEFFDDVFIGDGSPRLFLIRNCSAEEGFSWIPMMDKAGDILMREKGKTPGSGGRAIVLLYYGGGIGREEARNLLKEWSIKNRRLMIPVVVSGPDGEFFFNPLNIPLEFLNMVYTLRFLLRKEPAGEFADPREGDFIQMQTEAKMESFHRALFQSRPYVTWTLLSINILVFILMEIWGRLSGGDYLIQHGAKVGPLIWMGQYWRLLTPAFIHVGLLHLMSNCIILFFIGPIFEALMGSWRLAAVYVFSGISGNLLSLAMSPYPSAGASTGVFGILGAILIYGIRYRKEIPGHFYRVIVLYLFPFIIYNLILGAWYSNLDNFAHVGGLVGGVLLGLILSARYPANLPLKLNWAYIALFFSYTSVLLYYSFIPRNDAYGVYYESLGTLAASSEEYAGALSMLNQSREYGPPSDHVDELKGKIYANLGFERYNRGRCRDALVYLSRSVLFLSLQGGYNDMLAGVYRRMGQCLDRTDQNLDAIIAYRKALILDPQLKVLKRDISGQYLILSRKSLAENQPELAGRLSELALDWSPEDWQALEQSGLISYYTGDFYKAALFWRRMEKTNPDKGQYYLQNYIVKNLWYPEKKTVLNGSIPSDAVKANLKGEALLMKTGDFNQAEKYFLKAVKISPRYGRPRNNLAEVCILTGKPEKAEEMIKEVLKADKDNAGALKNLARLRYLKGDPASAKEPLKRIISADSDCALAFGLLGEIALKENNYPGALKNLKKAVALYPENALIRINLAKAQLKSGHRMEFYRQANEAVSYAGSQGRDELEVVIRKTLAFNQQVEK